MSQKMLDRSEYINPRPRLWWRPGDLYGDYVYLGMMTARPGKWFKEQLGKLFFSTYS